MVNLKGRIKERNENGYGELFWGESLIGILRFSVCLELIHSSIEFFEWKSEVKWMKTYL